MVVRGAFSYIGGEPRIAIGHWSDPLFRLQRLDTDRPHQRVHRGHARVFSRKWSGGEAAVDCNMATATLNFKKLAPTRPYGAVSLL